MVSPLCSFRVSRKSFERKILGFEVASTNRQAMTLKNHVSEVWEVDGLVRELASRPARRFVARTASWFVRGDDGAG